MIDDLEDQLKELFRGSQAHDIVPLLCEILRNQQDQLDALHQALGLRGDE